MRFSLNSAAALSLIVILASCVAPPRAAPVPPAPVPLPAPPPLPDPAPLPKDWRDGPLTAGAWRYEPDGPGSAALFGPVGGAALLTIRCEPAVHRIAFARATAVAGDRMTVRTTFATVQWPAQSFSGATPHVTATRAASDAALDQIAFSRGRFLIDVAGAPPLVLPNWAEVARVIEDCRG